MANILNIDTALDNATVSLAKDGEILFLEKNVVARDHIGFLHPAVEKILHSAGMGIKALDAIATNIGPGSYTGLRVGMAAAKGFCFATNLPLIGVKSLDAMAFAFAEKNKPNKEFLLCPMIDARRMEVYTAIYDFKGKIIAGHEAKILDEHSFSDLPQENKLICFGNGAKKFSEICTNNNICFAKEDDYALALAKLSEQKFLANELMALELAEPFYLKGFFTKNN